MNTEKKGPMRRNPNGQNDYHTERSFVNADIRAVRNEEEGKTKEFELSFSSEEPYQRWYGPEILDHSEGAVDLSRLKNIGVMLFNHNTNKVIGKVKKAWIEDNRGKAIVEFDDDDESETIRQKVENGTLKCTSVGYEVRRWEHVKNGEKSKDGRFKGECYIASKWQPLEISIVPVPADATVGVGRAESFDDPDNVPDIADMSFYERKYQYNVNRAKAAEKTALACK